MHRNRHGGEKVANPPKYYYKDGKWNILGEEQGNASTAISNNLSKSDETTKDDHSKKVDDHHSNEPNYHSKNVANNLSSQIHDQPKIENKKKSLENEVNFISNHINITIAIEEVKDEIIGPESNSGHDNGDQSNGGHSNLAFLGNETPILKRLKVKENALDTDSVSGRFSFRDTDSVCDSLSVKSVQVEEDSEKHVHFPKISKTRFIYVCDQDQSSYDDNLEMDQCGWGWVVVLAATVCNGTVFGVLLSFGVLYKTILNDEYNITLSDEYGMDSKHVALQTALVGSVADGVTFLMAPLTSLLMDRLGPRKVALTGCVVAAVGMFTTSHVRRIELLYLTYGITLGLGSSMIQTPSLVISSHYFEERLGLVNGLSTCGNAVFTASLPFLLVYLLSKLKLQTFMVLSAFYGLCFIAALTYKPRTKTREWKGLDKKLWRNKNYLLWILAILLSHFTMYVPIVHLVNHTSIVARGQGQPEIVQTIFGAVSGLSRLVIGPLSDLHFMRRHRIRLHQTSFLIGGVTTILIPLASQLWHFYIISGALGLAQALMIAQFAPVVIDLVGLKSSGQGVGFAMGCLSLPLMAAPPLAGFMYDSLGDYRLAFHLAGIPGLIAAGILTFVHIQWHQDAEGDVADMRPAPGTPIFTSKSGLHDKRRRFSRRKSVAHLGFI